MKGLLWVTSCVLLAMTGIWFWNGPRAAGALAYAPVPRPIGAAARSQVDNRAAAVAAAKGFLKAIGRGDPGVPSQLAKIPMPFGDIWDVTWNDQYWFVIDAETIAIRMYENSGRVDDQVHRRNRTGLRVIASKQAAEECARDLATKLKFPGEAFVESSDVFDDDDPGKTDANKIGKATVRLATRPYGYPFLQGGNGMSFDIDPQDGLLVQLFQNWEVEIASHDPRIAKEAAAATSQNAYESHYSTRYSPLRGNQDGSKPPKLGYVVPNGMFGSKLNETRRPFKARLAWVVYFGEESVWIDAGNGAVLGGELLK